MDSLAARYLFSARHCRVRDLEQLLLLSELVAAINALNHALQKERGASSIFVGSEGAQFAQQLRVRVRESCELEAAVRAQFERIDLRLDRMGSGGAFYTRIALALRALEGLNRTREQIDALSLGTEQVVQAFSNVIARLLSVVFEIAEIAADPSMSSALIALANFSQGKEYAGQERATAGAAISRGRIDEGEERRLRHLVAAQDHAFKIFCEFAEPPHVTEFGTLLASRASIEVKQARKVICAIASGELVGLTADGWYEWTTRRIDAMKAIEEQLVVDLRRLCTERLEEARLRLTRDQTEETDPIDGDTAPVVMLVTDVDPRRNNLGLGGGVGLFALDARQARTIRPILEVIQAQSRRIDDVNTELDSVRTALSERKLIERAKGLLMQERSISESAAYALMRSLAMSHNKKLSEVAAIVITRSGSDD